MKKIIISTLALVIGVTIFSGTAFADASLNNPGQMPTMTVANNTTSPCSFGAIDGCWKTTTTASPGDIIAAQIYFKNTSGETAKDVKVAIQPSRNGTLVTFNGVVVASNAPRVSGTATVTLSQVETITNMPQNGPYQADWRTNRDSSPKPVNTDQLFSTGFPIGTLQAGEQGVLTVRFMVNGTPTPTQTCSINNFSASPTTINLGSSSTLSWNTSNCDYVSISSVASNLATDGSTTVSPTNTTTYTLTAYPGGKTATATVTVTNTPPPQTCSINSFNASPTSIQNGNSSTLAWNTTNCTSVSISSVSNSLPVDGSVSVSPTTTKTYTLTALPGNKTATVTVTVTNAPVVCSIDSFTASPTTITKGNSSTLSWNTTNCDHVSITSSAMNLPADGSQSVSPTTTTTYVLTAFPGGKTATVTITVNNIVTNDCSINSFTASPNSIQKGDSSILNWNTTNCDHVTITNFTGTLASAGSQSVYPTNTTTYTLTAYPGSKTATVTVIVNQVTNNSCIINSFNASPSSINVGNSSILSWTTSNCSYVTISPVATGNLPTNGSGSVSPSNTTTYTLTAYPGGITSTVTVNVYGNNNNYCSINSFYVDSNSISQGQTTTLHWSTSGAYSVYITGFGSQNSSGSISISPYSSTSYTLTLNGSNCNGNTSQSVYVTVNQQVYNNNNNPVVQQPQAITTVASVLSSYSAQLNGIAVPNSTYGSASAWFEYGTSTSLGNRSDSQNVNGVGTYPYSANISGLAPGANYYYRAVVQNQAGVAYGSIVPFSTPSASTYTPPTKVVYVQSQTTSHSVNTGLIAKSQPSLFKLEVDSNTDHMCIGGDIDYTVNYQNISTQDLQNAVLRITFPGELTYATSSQGDYDVTDRTLTISLGDVQPGQQGSVTVHAQVNDQAAIGKLAVITATIVYTNPVSHAQENAIAYSLITVSNDCPSLLGASVFGFGGFLPTTLLGWLLLILIILALIVLARSLYNKKEEAK